MSHLAPGLAHGDRAVLTALFDHRSGNVGLGLGGRELAVAARPIGAAEPGIGEAYPCTQHDERKRKRSGETDQPTIRRRATRAR